MEIVYYTRPCYLDTALPFMKSLAAALKSMRLHVMVELSPQGWSSGVFDPPRTLPAGVMRVNKAMLDDMLPRGMRKHCDGLASFHLAVHKLPRPFSPASLRVASQAAIAIRRLKPDLLHMDGVSSKSAILPLTLRNIPFVLSIHDSEIHSGESRGRTHLVRKLVSGRAKKVIFHSQFCKETFSTKSVPSVVIPLGALDVFKEWQIRTLPEEPSTVLFFGRMSPYKGVETLMDAAPVVAKEIPDVRFIIAGKPITGYEFPRTPDLPNGGSFETYLEYVPNEDLCDLFQRSAMVVLPYNDATQSGVLVTAYAFQKPVVATSVGGLPEFIDDGKTGFLVPPRDPAALAKAIIKMLKDPGLRSRMAEGICKRNQTDLSWDTIAAQTSDLYNLVIHEMDEKTSEFEKSSVSTF